MRKENIIKAADKAKLVGETKDNFVKFFALRFPDEDDEIESYVLEWAERFANGDPELRMDSESLRIYEAIKHGINKI